ncbi:protein LIFEGUARD 2-like [Tasmannia lanceolata]|uniref:protein LIFEGUARD 2-like n=1 Tax=Tasmannia lanceolata TaxID=3420 RepID=UPI004063801E
MSRPTEAKFGPEIETGNRPLYPTMIERPELRWAFIRKVYAIVTVQLLLTIAVSSVIINVHPIKNFFVSSRAGLGVYIAIVISSFIVLILVRVFHELHPINFLLLMLFTVLLSFSLGLSCAFASGRVILEAVILTAVLVVSLSLYTFWAARRGHDFGFLGPFLFGSLTVLLVYGIIQIFFPLGKIAVMIYGALGVILFSGYIVYDTDNLIKRFTYDEYICASICLYLDIVNLFIFLLTLLGGQGDD